MPTILYLDKYNLVAMLVRELLYLFHLELEKVRKEKKDSNTLPYIVQAYNSVSKKIADNYNTDAKITKSDIMELNITQHMKNKLTQLLTSKIPNISIMRKQFLYDDLIRITGIGSKHANALIDSGLTTINNLKPGTKWWAQLNTDTKTAIATKPQKKIARANITKLEPTLTKFGPAKVVLVGSYRRKMPFSRDIDIMIVSPKVSILNQYIDYLKKKIPKIYIYSSGQDKISLIIDIGEKYKADIFRTHPDHYYSHLLYSTGSKANNIKMRARAKKMGLLLNQKGLWKGNERVLNKSANEREYYRYLGLNYLPPESR